MVSRQNFSNKYSLAARRCPRLLLVCALLAHACVAAEPVINESVEYYDVDADTLGTLMLELESEVPLRPAGNVYHGYTSSQVIWHWRYAQRGQSCQMMQVSSEANIAMTLPRLRRTRPGSEVARVWARWYPSLQAHERKHANNAAMIARRGETRLLMLPPRRDCQLLDEDAQRLARDMLEELRYIDRDYDRRTGHGASEGAALKTYLPGGRDALN